MNVTVLTAIAMTVSVIALLYLRNTDAKRRRSHHLPAWDKPRYAVLAWLFSCLPGVTLLLLQAYAAFIMWYAAYSLVGWLVALPKPKARQA